MNRYLKHEFRFNASHGNVGNASDVHSHTFSVSINTNYVEQETEMKLIGLVENFLKQFQGQNLNDMYYFEGCYPSVEEMGDRFYETLKVLLEKVEVDLFELGVADGPLTRYFVSDRIMLPNLNDNISSKNYDLVNKLLERIG